MSDTDTDTSNQAGNTSGDTAAADDEFKPITSQEDFEARLKDRLNRERAKYADYRDVKAKAARLDDIEEANKSEIQKASDRLAAAERERDEARVEALRFKVAAKHEISEEDADLFLTGTDEETLTRQAKRLGDREADRKRQGNHVAREGTTSPAVEGDELATTRALFGGGP